MDFRVVVDDPDSPSIILSSSSFTILRDLLGRCGQEVEPSFDSLDPAVLHQDQALVLPLLAMMRKEEKRGLSFPFGASLDQPALQAQQGIVASVESVSFD